MRRKQSATTKRSRGLSRREVIGQGLKLGGLALAGVLPPLSAPYAATTPEVEKELVFACEGGLTQKAIEQQIFPEFSKRYGGVKLTYIPAQGADNLAKLRAQKNNPTIDAMWLGGGITYSAIDEKLITEIDYSRLQNAKYISESLGHETAALPASFTTGGLLHHTDVFKQKGFAAPTSWFDMWDPKYKGHVGTYSVNVTVTPGLVALVSKILSGDDTNLDAGFAKFKELRPNMLDFYNSAGAWETAMQQGDLWLGMNTSVRALQMKNSGLPVGYTVPKEKAVGIPLWLGIVSNAPHPNVAYAWVDYLLSKEIQEKMPNILGNSPVNREAKVSPDLKVYFPEIDSVYIPDWRRISAQLPAIVDRWNREVER